MSVPDTAYRARVRSYPEESRVPEMVVGVLVAVGFGLVLAEEPEDQRGDVEEGADNHGDQRDDLQALQVGEPLGEAVGPCTTRISV
eukprot:2684917-Rhodomonas_salina.3